MSPFVLLALAYGAGATPTSFWLAKAVYGVDLRTKGSKNLGGTNTFRVLGWKAAVPVTLVDIGKGWLAVWYFSADPARSVPSDVGSGLWWSGGPRTRFFVLGGVQGGEGDRDERWGPPGTRPRRGGCMPRRMGRGRLGHAHRLGGLAERRSRPARGRLSTAGARGERYALVRGSPQCIRGVVPPLEYQTPASRRGKFLPEGCAGERS